MKYMVNYKLKFILLLLSFSLFGILNIYAFLLLNKVKFLAHNHVILYLIIVTFALSYSALTYAFYFSAFFSFADLVIQQNERITTQDLNQNIASDTSTEISEQDISDEELYQELISEISNFDVEERIRNQYDNYERIDNKKIVLKTDITEITRFNVLSFVMESDLYLCLKEDKKVQKNLNKVFSYVKDDILAFEKTDALSKYSEFFVSNNNNFMVEITINKKSSEYDIEIIISINGESLF